MLFLFHLLPLLLLQFPSSLAYSPPDKYFLNCGSKSDTKLINNRPFFGDVKNSVWSIYPGKSKVVTNNTIPKSINEVYQTARVYNKRTWYVFDNISPNETYVLRLHFFPTLPQIMSQARFNVSVSSGFQLLSNFSIQNKIDFETPIVKEFVVGVNEGRFGINFSPLELSLAFVNAIELFLAPPDFKPESSYPVSPEVRQNPMYNLAFNAWQSIYRVWMGDHTITPNVGTLWTTWLPDAEFMAFSSPVMSWTLDDRIKYNRESAIYIAPSNIFSKAKGLDATTTANLRDNLNITWVFNVKKKSKYFLRLLWCNIIKNFPPFYFDILIGVNRYSLNSSTDDAKPPLEPFWSEYVIYTDSSGYLNVGIARSEIAPSSSVFLNGIELMELIDKSLVGPVDLNMKVEKFSTKTIIALICSGTVVIVALIIGLALFCFVKGRKSREHRPLLIPQNFPSKKFMSIANLGPNLNLELKIPFGVINDATDGFHEKKIIGIGGFGKVYVGKIRDKKVAVKRSQPGHGQGIKEFQTEIIIFSQIRHDYLVSFYGYCEENQEMLLVYEYMEGGNLREYLYGSKANDHVRLPWKKRLEICIDAAKGLNYLHNGSSAGIIIHRDIKTTNILLDKDLNAKIADFGISKIRVPDVTEMECTMRGTYGYMDPEYLNSGRLKDKFDVYSFGVVLFEVLSARAPIDNSVPSEETYLVEWAFLCKNKGEIEKLIDPFLLGTIEANSLRKFVEVAEKCVNEFGAYRPSMHNVVRDLELALESQLTYVGEGKGYERISTTIVEAPWEIPSKGIDDSIMLDEDTTTLNVSELAAEFKTTYAR